MAVELVGAAAFPHVLIVTVIAYILTGHRGIYPAQRLLRRKHGGGLLKRPVPLREYRDSLPVHSHDEDEPHADNPPEDPAP
jgi:hypothetical protein